MFRRCNLAIWTLVLVVAESAAQTSKTPSLTAVSANPTTPTLQPQPTATVAVPPPPTATPEVPPSPPSTPTVQPATPPPSVPFTTIRTLYFMSPRGINSIRTDGTDYKLVLDLDNTPLLGCHPLSLAVNRVQTKGAFICGDPPSGETGTRLFLVDFTSPTISYEERFLPLIGMLRSVVFYDDETILYTIRTVKGWEVKPLPFAACTTFNAKDCDKWVNKGCLVASGKCIQDQRSRGSVIIQQRATAMAGGAVVMGDEPDSEWITFQDTGKEIHLSKNIGWKTREMKMVTEIGKTLVDQRSEIHIGEPYRDNGRLFITLHTEGKSYLALVDITDTVEPEVIATLPPFMSTDGSGADLNVQDGSHAPGVAIQGEHIILAHGKTLEIRPLKCMGCGISQTLFTSNDGFVGPLVIPDDPPVPTPTATLTPIKPATPPSATPTLVPRASTATPVVPLPSTVSVTQGTTQGTTKSMTAGAPQTAMSVTPVGGNIPGGSSDSSEGSEDGSAQTLASIIGGVCAGIIICLALCVIFFKYVKEKKPPGSGSGHTLVEEMATERMLDPEPFGLPILPGGAALAMSSKMIKSGPPRNPLIDIPHYDPHHDPPEEEMIPMEGSGDPSTPYQEAVIYEAESPTSHASGYTPTHRSFGSDHQSNGGRAHSGAGTPPIYDHHPRNSRGRNSSIPPRRTKHHHPLPLNHHHHTHNHHPHHHPNPNHHHHHHPNPNQPHHHHHHPHPP
eukprot:Sspe_Gene.59337::Locus_32578_Transcript_7_9_Confidence_0.297_Length_2400::g.59337::m.59337